MKNKYLINMRVRILWYQICSVFSAQAQKDF